MATNKHSTANTTDETLYGEIHKKGFSIIGSCENPNCAAHGEKVVLNLGYGEFKIIHRGQVTFKSSCPVCNSSITPKSSEFNDCSCKIILKAKSGDVQMSSTWRSAGECPKELDSIFNDIDNYIGLNVKAVNLDTLPIDDKTVIDI